MRRLKPVINMLSYATDTPVFFRDHGGAANEATRNYHPELFQPICQGKRRRTEALQLGLHNTDNAS